MQQACERCYMPVHENLCNLLIPLSKNNLKLLISHTDHYENRNKHYHNIFNFQHSSPESLQQ